MRVLIANKISDIGIERMKEKGLDVDVKTDLTDEMLCKILPRYDALIIRSDTTISATTLTEPGQLRVIGRAGTGVDNVDLVAATKKGIYVLNTPTANSTSVAELTIGLLLSTLRKIPYGDRQLRQGKWIKHELEGSEIEGKTVGLIGFGNIGQRVARRLHAFETTLIAYDPYPNLNASKECGVQLLSFEEVLQNADIISVHVPLLDSTRGMIGAREFSLMKDGVVFIHASRGGIVDDSALLMALQSEKVSAAGLDVFEQEPLSVSSPFLRMDNVVLTPHIGASTHEAQVRAGIEIAETVARALLEGKYDNLVNRDML